VKIAFLIFGEPASKANSRKLVSFGKGEKKRPGFIKSDKARAYEQDAIRQIPASARAMITGPVRVTIRIWYASERPDLDESVILDVLQAKYTPAKDGPRQLVRAGVYMNDRQVREKHIFHGIDRHAPRAEIEVEELLPSLPIEMGPVQPKHVRYNPHEPTFARGFAADPF
jgi:Holliday junction resolvase RusA-like endonuclease